MIATSYISKKILNQVFKTLINNRSRAPHPDREHCHATEFHSTDGIRLAGWTYRPSHHQAGTLYLQHGLTCHSMTMADLALRIADQFSMAAFSFDCRHHGLSDNAYPTFGYWEGRDMQSAFDQAERLGLPKPYIVIGDSLSGLAAQWVAANDSRVGAAIMLETPGWPWDAVGKALYNTFKALGKIGIPLDNVAMIGNLLHKAYDDDVLNKGQLLGNAICPPHNPLVLYIMGDQDEYDWQYTRRVFDLWYEGELGGWNAIPHPSDDFHKWFHLVEGAKHADGKPGTYDIHTWHRYHEVIDAFISTALNRGENNPAPPSMNHEEPQVFDRLVWEDNFDGNALDYTKWECEVNVFGGGNHEMQIYTDYPKNVRVEHSTLILEAHADNETLSGTQRPYSSGRVRTKHRGDWKYGRFEIRAKLPKGQGIWPAIWMLPTDEDYGRWAASGEIDIMEAKGHEPNQIYGTLHYGGTWPHNQSDGSSMHQFASGDYSDDFHVYRLDWHEDVMRWYVDNQLFRETHASQWHSASAASPAPFDKRFHLILNLAIGGNFPGNPNESTQFPCRMEVDWVRVYQ
jgi:beta-glucanase (GH16 family)